MLDRLDYRLEPQPTAHPIDLVRVATGFEPIHWASIGESFLLTRRHQHIDARSLERSPEQPPRLQIRRVRLYLRQSVQWRRQSDPCGIQR